MRCRFLPTKLANIKKSDSASAGEDAKRQCRQEGQWYSHPGTQFAAFKRIRDVQVLEAYVPEKRFCLCSQQHQHRCSTGKNRVLQCRDKDEMRRVFAVSNRTERAEARRREARSCAPAWPQLPIPASSLPAPSSSSVAPMAAPPLTSSGFATEAPGKPRPHRHRSPTACCVSGEANAGARAVLPPNGAASPGCGLRGQTAPGLPHLLPSSRPTSRRPP